MSDPTANGERHSEEWAPHDYTDHRRRGDWKTIYPPEAQKWIWIEAAYLAVLFLGTLGAVLYILHQLCAIPPATETGVAGGMRVDHQDCPPFLAFLGALGAGTLGGCSFGIKWMYHSVAKQLWHEDRRLWRFLTPPLSGVVSLFMLFLVSSGLLQIFDKEFVRRPIAVIAFSFVVGYFSDKALAKMAELADTLFGRTDKGPAHESPTDKGK